uniref:Uncharacterized protein n=1 Tax=Meloidogyne floridensis TaxID=298350 RepID=A0A915NJV7_9BILA
MENSARKAKQVQQKPRNAPPVHYNTPTNTHKFSAKQGQQKPISEAKFYGQNPHNNTPTNTVEEAKKHKEKEKEESKKEDVKEVSPDTPDSWKKNPNDFVFSPTQTNEKKRKEDELENEDLPIKKKFCGEGTRRLFHYDTPEKTDENLLKEFYKNSPTKHESKPNILNTHTKIENLQTENLAKVEEGGEVETPESWKNKKENEDFSFQQSQDSVNSEKKIEGIKEKKEEMNEDFGKLNFDDIELECNEDFDDLC